MILVAGNRFIQYRKHPRDPGARPGSPDSLDIAKEACFGRTPGIRAMAARPGQAATGMSAGARVLPLAAMPPQGETIPSIAGPGPVPAGVAGDGKAIFAGHRCIDGALDHAGHHRGAGGPSGEVTSFLQPRGVGPGPEEVGDGRGDAETPAAPTPLLSMPRGVCPPRGVPDFPLHPAVSALGVAGGSGGPVVLGSRVFLPGHLPRIPTLVPRGWGCYCGNRPVAPGSPAPSGAPPHLYGQPSDIYHISLGVIGEHLGSHALQGGVGPINVQRYEGGQVLPGASSRRMPASSGRVARFGGRAPVAATAALKAWTTAKRAWTGARSTVKGRLGCRQTSRCYWACLT